MALIGEMQYLTIGGNTYSIPTSGGSTVSITRSLTTGTKSATITIDGTSYDIYSTNNSGGTVTSVRVQATSPVQSSVSTASSTTLNTTISLASGYGDTQNPYASKTKNYVLAAPATEAGAPSFRALVAADIPDLSGTYLTSHQSIKTLHSKTLTGTGDVTLTYSDVGAAASSHAHGNITSGGDITATAPTITSGDQIIINDHSASKITNGPTFDGSTTTTALTPKGTWETFLKSYTEQYTGTITKVTTTAGAHTAVDVSSGAVSFNVPTKTSHLTNDSGYITSYTDEKVQINSASDANAHFITFGPSAVSSGNTYTLNYTTGFYFTPSTGNLLATKFNGYTLADACAKSVDSSISAASTSTNLPTSAAVASFVEGKGYITSYTDEKLKTVALTSGTTYYPILATGANAAVNRQVDSSLGGLKYISTAGTTSAVGTAVLQLGNATASGTANNEQGVLRLYGTGGYYTDVKANTGMINRTIYLPAFNTSMYLVARNNTDAVGGATTAPVYVDEYGMIQAVTSIPYSLLSGTPTIPVDTNTTYTLTNALSSHKFTWTLTAGGSGSGSTTTVADFVAGTGISLTDDTTNKKMTIACTVTNTDTLMTQAYSTTNNSYPLLMSATAGVSSTSSRGAVTGILNNALYANPSTGTLNATNLKLTRKINQAITSGTGTAASDKGAGVSPRYYPAKWTFNVGITPTDGDTIVIKTPVAGHSYGVYLSTDNGATYYPVVVAGTTRITTHFGVGTYAMLYFDSTGSASEMFALNGGDSRTFVSGGVWKVVNYYDSGNTVPSAYCSTAAATAAKVASMSGYVATANRYLMVTLTTANTSAGAITLNVNSTGAKPIYINGAASSSSNYTLPAGSYIVYYNGTNYYFDTTGDIPFLSTKYLSLTGGTITGATTFGSSVSIDEAEVGDLVVTGNVSFVNYSPVQIVRWS